MRSRTLVASVALVAGLGFTTACTDTTGPVIEHSAIANTEGQGFGNAEGQGFGNVEGQGFGNVTADSAAAGEGQGFGN